VLADLLTVLAGLLAVGVVRRTTLRQEQRAARLAGSGGPHRLGGLARLLPGHGDRHGGSS
jgi:hypothetical protein